MNEAKIAFILRKLTAVIRRRQINRDLEDELAFHLAMKQQENVGRGLDPRRAEQAARRDMGNIVRAKEDSREFWMFPFLETTMRDVLYAMRVLAKTPVFTACAVITLALGIGANTAIFSLIDALFLRLLPVPEPDRIVQITLKGADEDAMTSFTYPFFVAISEHTRSFSGVFSLNYTSLWTGWGPHSRQLSGAAASGSMFQTLQIAPQAGRLLAPADDRAGASFVAVISDRYWAREWNRDPRVIGRTILLDQHPFTIIGVTQRSFLGVTAGSSPDVTIPVHANAALHPRWNQLDSKNSWYINVLARLRPGVPEQQARAELLAISPAILHDQMTPGMTVENDKKRFLAQKLGLVPGAAGHSWLARRYEKSLFLLMALSSIVLLLACLNLASLSLARTAPRKKELAVCLALGAGRARLMRQLLTESILISTAGAACGVAFAFWATRGLVAFLSPEGAPLILDLSPDWRVLSVLAALATATGILIGIFPAIQGTDLHPNDALKQGKIGFDRAGKQRFSAGKALVVVQVGLSVLLVAGAVLLERTLGNLKWQNTGFDRNNVVFVEMNADGAGLEEKRLAGLYGTLLASMRSLPGVEAASLTNVVPVSGNYEWNDLAAQQWPNLTEAERKLYIHRVETDYFRAMSLRLLRGRDLRPTDAWPDKQKGTPSPAILSASAAHTYFPYKDPIGELLHEGDGYRIVGVVDDAKYADLREQSPRTMYVRIKPDSFCNLVVRGGVEKAAVLRELRAFLKNTGKNVRLGSAVSLTEQIDQTLVTERLVALLASFFAGLAALLAAIGLYGVVGSSVARRTSEIGVRIALGATPPNVLWLILREALLLSGLGILAGTPLALLCARLVNSMLYGVKPNDALSLILTVILMLAITTIAGLLPAVRAARFDPTAALRYE